MKSWQTMNLRIVLILILSSVISSAQQATAPLPSGALKFGAFVAKFDPGGTFTLQGKGWPALNGKWNSNGAVIELTMSGGPGGCDGTGRYEFGVEKAGGGNGGERVSFKLLTDDCVVRRMIVDRSVWTPADEVRAIPARRITLTSGARLSSSRAPKNINASWPSFRGHQASGVAEKHFRRRKIMK